MKKINLLNEVNVLEKLYVYKNVGNLNGHSLNVVKVENRTLDFDIHEHSDELFYVLEGSFFLETKEGKTKVDAGEFIIVQKGIQHRPVVTQLSKFLLIELNGTLNKENSGESYED